MQLFNALMTKLTKPCYWLLDWLEESRLHRVVFMIGTAGAIVAVFTVDWYTR